jgi:hypothetical protein
MQVETLLNASASTTASKSLAGLDNTGGEESLVWQCVLSSTGTVNIEGSLDGTNWASLVTAPTTSSIVTTARAPFVRARISANAGTITVMVAY